VVKKKKKQNSLLKGFLYKNKDKIIAVILLFFWVVSIFMDINSPFWVYLDLTLKFLFWIYYWFIFTPAIIVLWLLLLTKEEVEFNSFRIVWLLFYFTSLTSLIWALNSNKQEEIILW